VTEVVVLSWPADDGKLPLLAERRVPRLLLVEPEADPPVTDDLLEDWIRLPSDERDIRARLLTLRSRAAGVLAEPAIDGHSRFIFRDAWVALSPIEERLACVLADDFNLIVTEQKLLKQGWPHGAPSSNALRVHLHRLRQRIRPLGLELRAIRSQGWVLQASI
jgi:DNA-binding response OmpR family regulator